MVITIGPFRKKIMQTPKKRTETRHTRNKKKHAACKTPIYSWKKPEKTEDSTQYCCGPFIRTKTCSTQHVRQGTRSLAAKAKLCSHLSLCCERTGAQSYRLGLRALICWNAMPSGANGPQQHENGNVLVHHVGYTGTIHSTERLGISVCASPKHWHYYTGRRYYSTGSIEGPSQYWKTSRVHFSSSLCFIFPSV